MSHYIDPSSVVGRDTRIGEGSIVMTGVKIGEGCEIGSYVIIHPDTSIGSNVRIDDHSVIGKKPMRAVNSIMKDETLDGSVIGDSVIIGSFVTIYRGSIIEKNVLIADYASVREDVVIGDSTIIGRGVTVENHCRIGRFCKIESEAYITAYSTLEDRVFIAPGVVTSNDNFVGRTKERFKHFKGITVRRGGRIGAGAIILPGKVVGEDALIAAGAVLTHNAIKGMILAGVPAKPFREVPDEQLLENQDWADINKKGER